MSEMIKPYTPYEQNTLRRAARILKRRMKQQQNVFDSPDTVRNFLKAQMTAYEREVFACLFLDNHHRVLAFEELFYGTIDAAAVHPREVVKRALAHNAAAAILAHNHPSGIAEPSRADERMTIRIRDALALIDVRLLDHFVVGGDSVTSLAERGLV